MRWASQSVLDCSSSPADTQRYQAGQFTPPPCVLGGGVVHLTFRAVQPCAVPLQSSYAQWQP